MPTLQEIEAKKTANGGWTRARLAEWGVPWPPPKGWKKTLTAAAPEAPAAEILDLDCEGPVIPRRLTEHPAFRAIWSVIGEWNDPVPTGAHVLMVLRALRDAGVVILATK